MGRDVRDPRRVPHRLRKLGSGARGANTDTSASTGDASTRWPLGTFTSSTGSINSTGSASSNHFTGAAGYAIAPSTQNAGRDHTRDQTHDSTDARDPGRAENSPTRGPAAHFPSRDQHTVGREIAGRVERGR